MNGKDGLEAVTNILYAGIMDRDKPYALAANADIGNRDTELFQAGFQWFDSKILIRHEVAPF